MSTLQIREVPAEIKQTLKVRAAASGRSLSEYLLDILTREATQPTMEELLARVKVRGSVDYQFESVDILRAERDGPR